METRGSSNPLKVLRGCVAAGDVFSVAQLDDDDES